MKPFTGRFFKQHALGERMRRISVQVSIWLSISQFFFFFEKYILEFPSTSFESILFSQKNFFFCLSHSSSFLIYDVILLDGRDFGDKWSENLNIKGLKTVFWKQLYWSSNETCHQNHFTPGRSNADPHPPTHSLQNDDGFRTETTYHRKE